MARPGCDTRLVVMVRRRVGGWWSIRCIETIRHTGSVVNSNQTNGRTDGRPPTLPWFPPSPLTRNPNWVLNSGLLCGVVRWCITSRAWWYHTRKLKALCEQPTGQLTWTIEDQIEDQDPFCRYTYCIKCLVSCCIDNHFYHCRGASALTIYA